ncbi:hypothetical protein fugu_012715 [Takifugu bimaculatus]|uniref:Exonuclease 1 n=1 Tax=Takifugu bimaculatus TaxID=433685 RepID=A0A4Z2C665_9TELE|nr:hypothetical protein fugu_012715 [Takifugu bimaculatus]
MGIPGLLQFIKDAAEPISIKKYKGQTVAVDTYCWLHKGAFSCAEKLAKGEPTDQYVWYCMRFVEMLLTFRIKPILVFDGRNLPSKQEVERARRERRTSNLQKGRQLLREGKVSEARDCFTRSVSITPAMAHNLMKAARARGVDCIVAPYEADAQLAYLTKWHLAQAVITEDSDLLAFGCKKVILKMDKHGNGLEIDQNNLGRCRALGNIFTEEKFRHMCILSGCDYLPSLHGIGLGKACKLLRLAKEPDITKVIRKMAQYLKMNLLIPEQYIEGFTRANNTFLYQLVFDPVSRKVVPLNPYPDHISGDTLTYAGSHFGEEIELQLAMGNLDIETLERIDDFNPDKSITKASKGKSHSWKESCASTGPSIWSRDFSTTHPSELGSKSAAASPERSSQIKEKETGTDVLRRPCRELQLKRPREGSVLSDQDLLLQYCGSEEKRRRCEPPPARQPSKHLATVLQRRNQDAEEGDGDTCSRFFRSCSSGHRTADTPVSGCVLPRTASRGFRLFDWSSDFPPAEQPSHLSRTSSLVTQQQEISPPGQSAASRHTDSNEDRPDSPLSQDSAYWSQSQPHQRPSYQKEDAAVERTLDSASEQSVSQAEGRDETPRLLRSKPSGLTKPASSSRPGTRTKLLGPARVSGLRGKAAGSENTAGFQATISSLWKNFGFQKTSSVMSPCKK